MATLGPVSRDETVLRGLVRAGVDLFRLNLSHGTQEQHRETLRRVRKVAAEERCHLPVVLDLMGPRYRLGQIPDEPRQLRPGQEVVLGIQGEAEDGHGVDFLPVDPEILEHLEPCERVLIDSGLIELKVTAKQGNRVTAKVVNGGPVKTRKGINLPDSTLPFEISEKDRSDIAFAVRRGRGLPRRELRRRGLPHRRGARRGDGDRRAHSDRRQARAGHRHRAPRRDHRSGGRPDGGPRRPRASRCRSIPCRCSRRRSWPPAAAPASR